MRLSLILATVGRTVEVQRFLGAAAEQTLRDFEIIVVDQNQDDRLVGLIDQYRDQFTVVHLRSEPGLSRARNLALNRVRGDLVAFPDDDCWYPPNLLERVTAFFDAHPYWMGLTGRCVDEERRRPLLVTRHKRGGPISRSNVWSVGMSACMFLRSSVLRRVGEFDETLGVGAATPWKSGEETDYLLRALDRGAALYHDPEMLVHHPPRLLQYDRAATRRAYSYSMGTGRVLRKHSYSMPYVARVWMRSAAGAGLALLTGRLPKSSFYFGRFRGQVAGWFARSRPEAGG